MSHWLRYIPSELEITEMMLSRSLERSQAINVIRQNRYWKSQISKPFRSNNRFYKQA